MGAYAAFGAQSRAVMLVVGGVVVAALGYWVATAPEPRTEGEEALAVTSGPASGTGQTGAVAVASLAEPATTPSAPQAAQAAAAPQPPVILTWAVTAAGAATIAGQAEPGSQLRVLVDELEVARTKTTPGGEFAVVTTLAPNAAPSLLRIIMLLEDGREIAAKDIVALAPIAGPVSSMASALPDTAEQPGQLAADADGVTGTALLSDASTPAAGAVAGETGAHVAASAAAGQAPQAVMLTQAGTVVLQGQARPEAGSAGAPLQVQTITYLPEGPVQIGGTAAAGLVLRLYLDTALQDEAAVNAQGQWQVTLGDVTPGLYTLRADALDAAGKVVARVEMPFQRESRAALAAASAAPGMAQGDVALSPSAGVAAPADLQGLDVTAASDAATSDAVVMPAAGQDSAPSSLAQPAPPDLPDAPRAVSITVQPGHTLWAIAQGELGDGLAYVQVWQANRDKIGDPDLIYPGQVVTIPGR